MKRVNCVNWLFVLLSCLLMAVTGCSSDGGGSGGDGDATGDQSPALISIGVSSAQVKSDNSESISVTASVLDDKNVAVSGVTVSFSASGGVLADGSAVTDENGLATVAFSSGLNDKSNRQVTIEAATASLSPVQVPVQITGSTINLTSLDTQTLDDSGANLDRLIIQVTDAGGVPIFNTPVSLSISGSSTGRVNLPASSEATDVNGEVALNITGSVSGNVTLDVTAAGATASIDYIVQVSGSVFGIVSPTEDPTGSATTEQVIVSVDSPSPGPGNMVVFSTTLGVFSSGGASGRVLNVPVTNGRAQAALTSSEAGIATIQVNDFNDTTVKDSMTVAFYAPASQASQVTLQISNSVVATSIDDVKNTVNLYASVLNQADQVVGGAPVLFTLSNTTGGGEFISPAIAYTDSSGVATSIFTSGSLGSDAAGVLVTATVMGGVGTPTDSVSVVIGGTASSIGIGLSTKIAATADDTAYEYAVSVIVADANGNPVPNAQVSLKLWPRRYRQGQSVTDRGSCTSLIYDNEDQNRNLRLDPGEDLNSDGMMTPIPSAAGTIPATVTVDEFGVGTFKVTFLKTYSTYIEAELTASTIVGGSEYSSQLVWWHSYAENDEPYLDPSPFNDDAWSNHVLWNCR